MVVQRHVGEANEERASGARHHQREYDDAMGGGICQVATTVFNAVYDGGLSVTERLQPPLLISELPRARRGGQLGPRPRPRVDQ